MSHKMRFSPRIYWLFSALLFFSILGCKSSKSVIDNPSNRELPSPILYHKYTKKLTPKIFAEGSTYYHFVEKIKGSSHRKQEVFFVPPLANEVFTKRTEPIDSKRFGNFLIKESA